MDDSCLAHLQVALLKALALLASELPSVPDATLQQCLGLAERIAGAYPGLWPKQRVTVDDVFRGMLQALSGKQACPLQLQDTTSSISRM